MNQVINADFTSLERRILADLESVQGAITFASIRPRGERISAPDFLIGLQRDPLVAPGKCTINVVKPRPTVGIMHNNSSGIHPSFNTPFIHRVRGGLQ